MSKIATIEEKQISQKTARAAILAFEAQLKTRPEAVIGDSDTCPLQHTFCKGMYLREITIPAGMAITGKIHFHEHPVFLMEGEILVATEEGVVHLMAPQYFISPPGVKRAAITLADTVWVTVHLNLDDKRDLKKIEERVIATDYSQFDKYVAKLQWRKKSFIDKILTTIKNLTQ